MCAKHTDLKITYRSLPDTSGGVCEVTPPTYISPLGSADSKSSSRPAQIIQSPSGACTFIKCNSTRRS